MDLDRVPDIAKYLSAVFLLAWIGRSTVWMFLPIFFRQQVPSVFLIGIMTSLPAAIPILLDIPVGNLVQRVGEKFVIFLGLSTAVLPGLLYFSALPILLVLGKAFEGVAKVFIWNGGWSLSMRSADDDVESESISVFLLGINLSVVIGPIFGGFLIQSYGFKLPFLLWIFASLFSIIVFYSYIGLELKEGISDSFEELMHRKTYMDEWGDVKENWSHLWFPFSLVFLYSIIFSFYWLAMPLLLDKVDAGYIMMGIIFGVAAMPKVLQFLFGELADRFGRMKVLSVLALLLAPTLVAMNFVTNVVLLGVLFFIARIFSSGMSPAIHAEFDNRCPDELEGELTGFLELFKHAGQTLGPFFAGTIASIWGLQVSFLAASGVAVAILGFALLGRN
ncbi:MAG: MFS transporter [Candidatus Nanohalobium sp.]